MENPESVNFEKEKQFALAFFREGAYDEALSHFKKAVDIQPEYAEGYCNIGSILFEQGDLKKAEDYFKKSLQKNADLPESYFNLGCLYQEKQNYKEAISFFKEVVLRQEKDAETFRRMGLCACELNRREDAMAFFNEALRLRPNHLETGATLASLYIESEDYENAENVLRLILISYPEEVSIHFTLGLVLKAQKKFESALSRFNQVVTLEKANSEGFFHLGDCCLELGLLKQAEPFFAKAFKLDASFFEAVLQLGRVYEKMNKKESAVVMYRQWIEMVEKSVSSAGMEIQKIFKAKCLFITDFYTQKGKMEEVSFYRGKADQIGAGWQEEKTIKSDTREKEYRVSLKVEDD